MAATDVLELQWAKDALRVSVGDPREHPLLEAYVTAVSQRLDQACGPIVQRTVTDEFHSGGCGLIRLRRSPVASVTTVTEYDTAGTGTVLTAEDYDTTGTYALDPWPGDPSGLYHGKLWRRTTSRSGTWFVAGRNNVRVTYVAGRYATTLAAQQSRFGQAALVLLRWMWAQEQVGVSTVGEFDVPTTVFPRTMPLSVRQILANDWVEGVVVV